MQIKQNANRAASLVRQLLAFSRRQTLRPQVLDLGEVLVRPHHAAAPADRREGRARRRARPRPVAGEGRHLPVRAGDRQSRGQRARRHAGRRQAHGAHRQCHARRNARVCHTRACRPPTMCWSRSPTPAPASRRRSSTRFSSRSSRPRRSARAPGLGLSTVYGIVKQTGGFIYPDSAIGKGTTVPHLPAAPCAERGRGGRRDAAHRSAGHRGRVGRAAEAPARAAADLTGQGTILLVEDEEGLRALNARGLKSRGYTRARGRQRRRGAGGVRERTAARSISWCRTW